MVASMHFYIYLHCKPDDTPFYVGKGTDRRSHSKKNRNKHHRNVTAKYGWENIEILVFPRDTELEAFADEIKWIQVLRAEGYGLCNLTDGGEGCSGLVQTVEARLKIAAALIGKKQGPRSVEWRARLSAANKGRPPAEHALVAAVKANIKRTTGVKRPPELFSDTWREKQSAAHKGVPWSEARRVAQNKRSLII